MLYVFLTVLGLCLGSFVNAFVWRLKKKKDWVRERSICTHCGHTLAARDLVPVLSWVSLRGRCRYCKKRIEDSPLVELITGLAFLTSYVAWPYGFEADGWIRFIVWLVALVLLAAMFVYDLKWMLLPNKLTYALLVLGAFQLILMAVAGDLILADTLAVGLAVIIGGGIFHVIYLFSKGKYIGGGDVKFGYAYGLLLMDPLLVWFTLMIASTIGSLLAVGLIAGGRAKLSSKLPFGPMLILGVFTSMLFGSRLWDWVGSLWY